MYPAESIRKEPGGIHRTLFTNIQQLSQMLEIYLKVHIYLYQIIYKFMIIFFLNENIKHEKIKSCIFLIKNFLFSKLATLIMFNYIFNEEIAKLKKF